MATGFDELVEQLLYDVALSGSQGLGADELERAVKAFYESRQQTSESEQFNEEDLLFSDAPPTNSIVVDETFLDVVWGWLEKHPEINIEVDEDPTADSKHAGQRIFTSEERTWQVIAGHGVDHSRLPRRSFECLSVIAAHGPDGILQPGLTQITGQDKRSVPGRTDFLAENGYIVKLQAYDGRHKTSLLKLKKYAASDGTSKPVSALERMRMYPEAESTSEQDTDKQDQTFGEIIQMLKDNDGTVAITDLCSAYELRKNTAIKKHFLLSLDRLVECGCTRRVTALVESSNNQYLACLQLVREPTEQDREAFTGRSNDLERQADELDQSLDTQNDDVNQTIEEIEDDSGNDDEAAENSTPSSQRIPPQWKPDIPQNNLIFNIIDKAGAAGISSMDLHKQSMGSFSKRSLDDLLLRLTDVWQVSQPSHLKHLGIVRDTEVEGRSAHFQFRTLPNFEKAVELGLTAWEAVTDQTHDGGQKKLGRPPKSMASPELDKFGFPKLDPKLFADKEGRSSLAQCAEPARKAMSRIQATMDSPSKGRQRKIEKAPIATSSVPPSGRKKRKYTMRKRVASNLAHVSSAYSNVSPTGRKKRKARRKRLGSNLRNVSPGVTESEELLDQDPDDLNTFSQLDGTVLTPGGSSEKRTASEARLKESSRIRKLRKVDETPSTPPTRHDEVDEFEPHGQQILGNEADRGETTHSRVSFNSPHALELRFENYNGPGKRPKAKVAVIKSERLKNLQCFNPNGVGLVVQSERNASPAEMETLESDNEPPLKKSRLADDGVQGFSMSKIFGGTPADPPIVQKRRGRPPKRKSGDSINQVQTPGPSTPSDIGISVPDTPRSIIAKLPLRRSLLERFKQRSQDKDVEISDRADRPSRIVTMPLPQAMAVADMAAQDSAPTRQNRKRSFSSSLAHTTPSVMEKSRPSLIVKLGLPQARSTTNDEVTTQSDLSAITYVPETAPRPAFGLNIVKPYLGTTSATKTDQVLPLSTATSSDNGVVRAIDQGYHDNLRMSNGHDTPGDIPGPTDDTEDIDDDNANLSALLPADVDNDDGYRDKATQKAGTTRQGGFIHLRRTHIVMDTMRKAGGVFPGDHEMWYPFVTAWQKTYPHLPDRRTIENVVNLLVKQKKLNRFSFSFKDKSGKTVQRHIITEPGISPSSAHAKEVQRSIIESYPFRYLPKQVHIAKHLRDRARQTPVTQGGTRTMNNDDPKGKDPTYTPIRTRTSSFGSTKRSGKASVSFDLKTQSGQTQTPQVTRTASFAPRSILKIRDDVPQPIDLEEDNFDSDDETDTTTSESFDEDDSALEVSPEQAAMQGNFGLERYQHEKTPAPKARQGTRAMRTLKVGKEIPIVELKSPPTAELETAPIVLNKDFTQVFHKPSGTFGTVFKQRSRAGRPRRLVVEKVDVTPPKVNGTLSVPRELNDILKHSALLGRRGPDASDSRFHQFKNEVDRVNAWEKAMISANPTMDAPSDAVFINHSLKQHHELATDPDVAFVVEFVDGSLKPFILDSERKKRSQTARRVSVASSTPTTTPSSQYVSPYGPPPPTPATSLPPQESTTNQTLSFVPFVPRPTRPLLPLKSGDSTQTVQTAADSPTSMPTAYRKTSRPHTYKTRKSGSKRLTVDPADAASQFVDRDSDGDYRPGQGAPAMKKSSGKKLLYQTSRKQAIYNKFSPADFKRLALAVALARTICGGTGNLQVTNYDAVALALGSNHEVEDLKHYWQLPRKHGYDLAFAKKLQQAMYDPFLKAYENGELPRVEFNDLQNTDWPALLYWANAKVLPLVEAGPVEELPKERGDLQAVPTTTSLRILEEANSVDSLPSGPDSSSNQIAAPVRQRGQNLAKASSVLDQNYILEKSWIRAVMITKDEVYDENVAANKLSSINPATLEKATQEMLDTKTIKWKKVDRQQPGRSYMISPNVMSQLERWSRSHRIDFLKSLVAARSDFVRHFQGHDQLELSVDVTEAQLTVLTNMVAQGHLMMSPVLPARNDDFDAPGPKWSKWGPLKGTYDEDQSALPSHDIKVVYKKTPPFTSDHGLKLEVPIPTHAPSFPGESGTRIPFWIDINGNVMDDMWSKVVQSILHLLVHAPGCTAKSIERAHDSKLWVWEIAMVIEWMEAVGLAKKTGRGIDVDGGREAGWRASELWHCVSVVAATKSEDN